MRELWSSIQIYGRELITVQFTLASGLRGWIKGVEG